MSPTAPQRRYSMADIREADRMLGHHFFDRSTMRFFDSRVESRPYQGPGGVFFITSEQFHGSQGSAPRKYTIRQFDPASGTCKTVGKFNMITDKADARQFAREYARGELSL